MGLYGTDIITDWLNGSNLIQEGHVMWGWVMVLLPFLPGAIVGLLLLFNALKEKKYCNFVCLLLFCVPGVVLGTPLCMVYTMFTFLVKLFVDTSKSRGSAIEDGNFFLHEITGWFMMAEVVGESCTQAMLGKFLSSLLCL